MFSLKPTALAHVDYVDEEINGAAVIQPCAGPAQSTDQPHHCGLHSHARLIQTALVLSPSIPHLGHHAKATLVFFIFAHANFIYIQGACLHLLFL